MDGSDDLGAIDPAQIPRRDRQTGMLAANAYELAIAHLESSIDLGRKKAESK